MKTTRSQNLLAAVLVGALAIAGCAKPEPAQTQDDNKPKPATEATKQVNAAWLQRLDFANKQDFEDAKQGFIEALPDGGVVKNDKGEIVWDPTKFDFIGPDKATPDTVNPSLWRMSQLLSLTDYSRPQTGFTRCAATTCQ